MAITREQIWAVADELDGAGHKPTLNAVRKAVGGGSFTTIQDALSEWKAKRAAQASPSREPPPAALAERVSELAGDVWTMAMDLASVRLSADREALERERVDLDAARLEAAELADELTRELEEARTRAADLERALSAAQGDSAGLRERVAVLSAKAESAEEQIAAERLLAKEAGEMAAMAREDRARLSGRLAELGAQLQAAMTKLEAKKAR